VEAIAQYRKHQPDIALIDLRLPRLSGVEVIERIRMETPQARFIVLTTYDGDEDILPRAAGRRARLSAEGHDLGRVDRGHPGCSCGQIAYSPAIAQRLAERMGHRGADAGASSTCWSQIVRGLSNKDIATELEIQRPP